MNKSRHVTFRCTQEQYAAIKAYAEKNDITVSRFLQRVCVFASSTPVTSPWLDMESTKDLTDKP